MTDRGLWVARLAAGGNVRRLMYQSLIWAGELGDEPCRLRPPVDAEDAKRLADPLVDGVRGDAELGRDFLRQQMLVDEAQAVELSRREAGDALLYLFVMRDRYRRRAGIGAAARILQDQFHSAQHESFPRARLPPEVLCHIPQLGQIIGIPGSGALPWVNRWLAGGRYEAMVERAGFEPPSNPLAGLRDKDSAGSTRRRKSGGEGWIRTSVRLRGQIYSLLPLTTRPPLHEGRNLQAGAPNGGAGALCQRAPLTGSAGRRLICVRRALKSKHPPDVHDFGAGEGNRTLVVSLEGFCSTIELHPRGAGQCHCRREAVNRDAR